MHAGGLLIAAIVGWLLTGLVTVAALYAVARLIERATRRQSLHDFEASRMTSGSDPYAVSLFHKHRNSGTEA